MLGSIRKLVRQNLFLRKLVGYHFASSGLFDNYFRDYKVGPVWKNRIDAVLNSPDLAFIPKQEGAGSIKAGKQIMHNGLKIRLGSYYGPEYAKMLMLSGGVHEPQEERVFMEVLKSLPAGAVMIEMGAFWSFYSMWFQKEVERARNFMIEPDAFNLGQGQRNFSLNKMTGVFHQAFVGRSSDAGTPVPVICVDDFVKRQEIDFVHVLHSDIQGFEHDMLLGAVKTIDRKKVGYIFISTHSNEVHRKCEQFLRDKNFLILASADLNQTFSEDGLIVARALSFPGISPVNISLKNNLS